MSKAATLPFAPDRQAWGFVERSELGVHGACDVTFRTPCEDDEDGPELPPRLLRALPLLLHDFHNVDLRDLPGSEKAPKDKVPPPSPAEVLGRILPRLVTYRYVESEHAREFVFAGSRPSSLHVLSRVLTTGYRFRLEDLSHLATHGELLVEVLGRVGLEAALDPEAILYVPSLDAPYPFKFSVVGRSANKNREIFLRLLHQVVRATESDEQFRDRHFKELQRGFQKFGPAAATPQFQEVELRLWRLLSYMAARLRVKAGRLSDTRDPAHVRRFLAELRDAHGALDDLVHLPSRLAALFRGRFDIEFGKLHEHALPEVDAVAKRIDCDPAERDRSIEAVAGLVSTFRKLGSSSPLEGLEVKDREIKLSYGDTKVPPLETGWARTYTDAIFTGAARFDTRRFGPGAGAQPPAAPVVVGKGKRPPPKGHLEEEDFELDLDFLKEPRKAEAKRQVPAPEPEPEEPEAEEPEAPVDDPEAEANEPELSDSSADWRFTPGAEWETSGDLDALFGSDDAGPAAEEDPGGDGR